MDVSDDPEANVSNTSKHKPPLRCNGRRGKNGSVRSVNKAKVTLRSSDAARKARSYGQVQNRRPVVENTVMMVDGSKNCAHQADGHKCMAKYGSAKRAYSRPAARRTSTSVRRSSSIRPIKRPYRRRLSTSALTRKPNTIDSCNRSKLNLSPSMTEQKPNRVYFRRKSRNSQLRPFSRDIRTLTGHGNEIAGITAGHGLENHEAFIKAFAIPTHLYRYLSERHKQRPLFLNRNLSYLRAPRSPSTVSPKSKPVPHPLVNDVAEKLFQDRVGLKAANSKSCKKVDPFTAANGPAGVPSFLPVSSWPQEVQLIFEGFFDSEKELEWITVEASVNVQFRFGWAWRHKPCVADTLVSMPSNPFPLSCHHPSAVESESSKNQSFSVDCRFQPQELINQAKWAGSGGRVSSGQLELRIAAVERRWPRKSEMNRCLNGFIVHGLTDAGMCNGHVRNASAQHLDSKGLESSAYPVCYSAAPLPLFYPPSVSGILCETRPFLLTPGVYELRLGVDHADNYASDKNSSATHGVPAKSSVANGHNHDGSSTTDSMATSTSDFPNGTVCSADETPSLSEAGAASGRVEWHRIRYPRSSDALDGYSRWPQIKFRVIWHDKIQKSEPPQKRYDGLPNGSIETRNCSSRGASPKRSVRTSIHRTASESAQFINSRNNPLLSSARSSVLNAHVCDPVQFTAAVQPCKPSSPPAPSTVPPTHPITYRFLYLGHLQQWSESKDLVCPWCYLDCSRAGKRGCEALLVHLRTCHPRFRFKAIWSSARSHLSLEVSLNDAYDGSNDCGLRRWSFGPTDCNNGRRVVTPGQLVGGWAGLGLLTDKEHRATSVSLAGCATRVSSPVRRLPYTHLIYWRGAERSLNQRTYVA
ncbi:unnamed protein product [Calicophoron daubneyi]|uniref:Polycomb protein SUZ12-like zinc finger domain-containing protein n=1 Tax=Calicophoron daubneyi TaxID=300641 RepID=A0AAV2TNJ8_CALDB